MRDKSSGSHASSARGGGAATCLTLSILFVSVSYTDTLDSITSGRLVAMRAARVLPIPCLKTEA